MEGLTQPKPPGRPRSCIECKRRLPQRSPFELCFDCKELRDAAKFDEMEMRAAPRDEGDGR